MDSHQEEIKQQNTLLQYRKQMEYMVCSHSSALMTASLKTFSSLHSCTSWCVV